MEEKKRYRDRTQITFSLPFELKNRVQDIIQNINKKLNKDLNLSRFCVSALNLNCKVNEIKNFKYFKEVFDDILISNNMLNLKQKKEIVGELEKFIRAYKNELDEYFKFKKDLDKDKQKEFEKFEELGQLPSEYYFLKRQKDEINK